jgi:single-strand DNA-binding protein
MSVNKVILVGRTGVTPELKNLKSDSKVVNFSFATSEHYKDKTGAKVVNTEWHNIVAWGPLAEIIAKNVVKGQELYIEGKIQTRSYDDKDGIKKYATEIVASNITFIGSKKTEDGATAGTEASAKTPATATATATKATPAAVTANVDDNEDLPF